jgi:hypothetical protein
MICVIALEIASIFAGCICPTGPAIFYMKVNRVRTWSLDNSGSSPVISASGAIPARGLVLALHVEWRDTLYSSFLRAIAPATALAMSECPTEPPVYKRLDTIASAEVIRVDGSGAEREVGESFMVGLPPVDIESAVNSFSRFDRLAEMLNIGEGGDPTVAYLPHLRGMLLYLREGLDAMKGSDVRFIVRLGLTDGRMVADTTDPITIL